MNYHNITHDDMRNGDGLRVVLWVSGCNHQCPGCQNPITWDPSSGLHFDFYEMLEIGKELKKDYVAGITFSGGDPLYPDNRGCIRALVEWVHTKFPGKTVWIYTGYTWDEIMMNPSMYDIMKYTDVLVDGEYKENLSSINYHWAGSTNQRVIDVQKSLKEGVVVLHDSH